MLLKILFWLFVCIDAVAIAVFGLLGLAAAKPSHTNPIAAIVIPFLIPAVILLGAIWLFVSSQSFAARCSATAIAALPFLIVGGSMAVNLLELSKYRDGSGNITQFRSEGLRDVETAIERNDATAVTAAAKGVDINTPGLSGATVLVLAMRQLQHNSHQLDVIKALLAAGANPNFSRVELPLQIAISESRKAGIELVQLLLDAGANPNAMGEWGDPIYFIAGGAGIQVEVMELLLARGADIRLKSKEGESAVVLPVRTGNWPVLELLLKRGAPWEDQRPVGGLPLLAYLENEVRKGPSPWQSTNRLNEVLALLRNGKPSAQP